MNASETLDKLKNKCFQELVHQGFDTIGISDEFDDIQNPSTGLIFKVLKLVETRNGVKYILRAVVAVPSELEILESEIIAEVKKYGDLSKHLSNENFRIGRYDEN